MADTRHADLAASGAARHRHVFVRDLVMRCSIGVHAHELQAPQRVRINIDLTVAEGPGPIDDDLRNVVCYDEIITALRRLVAAGHIRLLETLAERIADLCLGDARIIVAHVQVEKLDVYGDVGAVGIAIERRNMTENSPHRAETLGETPIRADQLCTSRETPVKCD